MKAIFQKKDGKYYYLDNPKECADSETVAVIVGPNSGMFMLKTPGFEIFRPLDKEIKDAVEVKEIVTFSYPTISYDIYWKSLCFLRAVYKEHKAEGAVLLTLNRNHPLDKQEYKIHIPVQEVAGAAVDYKKINELPFEEGEFLAGTIHSHPGFGAFQSGTDHADELHFDGPHITLGYIDREVPEIHERLCLAGVVYDKLKNPLMKITPPPVDLEIPQEIKDQIQAINDTLKEEFGIEKKKSSGLLYNVLQVLLRSTTQPVPFEVPAEWMKNVTSKSYSYQGGSFQQGKLIDWRNRHYSGCYWGHDDEGIFGDDYGAIPKEVLQEYDLVTNAQFLTWASTDFGYMVTQCLHRPLIELRPTVREIEKMDIGI